MQTIRKFSHHLSFLSFSHFQGQMQIRLTHSISDELSIVICTLDSLLVRVLDQLYFGKVHFDII